MFEFDSRSVFLCGNDCRSNPPSKIMLKSAYENFGDERKNPKQNWYRELIEWAKRNQALSDLERERDLRQLVAGGLEQGEMSKAFSFTIDGYDSVFFEKYQGRVNEQGGDIHWLSDVLRFSKVKKVDNETTSELFRRNKNLTEVRLNDGDARLMPYYPRVKYNPVFFDRLLLNSQVMSQASKGRHLVLVGMGADCDACPEICNLVFALIEAYLRENRKVSWFGPWSRCLEAKKTDMKVDKYSLPHLELVNAWKARAAAGIKKKGELNWEPYKLTEPSSDSEDDISSSEESSDSDSDSDSDEQGNSSFVAGRLDPRSEPINTWLTNCKEFYLQTPCARNLPYDQMIMLFRKS